VLISVPFTTRTPEPVPDGATLLSRSDPVVEDEVHGVLHIYRPSTEGPNAGRLEQLRVFAEQGAVAIRNVRKVERVTEQLQTSASLNTRLLGRERFINQLQFRIQQLEQELSRYKAA
jgi:GAF domain-containing protein